jgi:hypothetical protein
MRPASPTTVATWGAPNSSTVSSTNATPATFARSEADRASPTQISLRVFAPARSAHGRARLAVTAGVEPDDAPVRTDSPGDPNYRKPGTTAHIYEVFRRFDSEQVRCPLP